MARNRIQRPRFYVDLCSYWKLSGLFPNIGVAQSNTNIEELYNDNEILNLFGLDYTNAIAFNVDAGAASASIELHFAPDGEYADCINELNLINYYSILGHNLAEQGVDVNLYIKKADGSTAYSDSVEGILNGSITTLDDGKDLLSPKYNGTSIVKFDGYTASLEAEAITGIIIQFTKTGEVFTGTEVINLSSISIGRTFTMPISPDLKTSISYDYGITSQEGIDGSTFENINYLEPRRLPNGFPVFYVDNTYDPDLGVDRDFLNSNRNVMGATGRRSWSMNFTAVASSELFPANSMETFSTEFEESGTATTGGYSSDHTAQQSDGLKYFSKNLATDTSFYTLLVHRTLGGSLSMIYQSFTDDNGNGNNNSGEFAIVKLNRRGMQFNVNTFNTYNIGFSVRESW